MASTKELDRLINSLPEEERVNFITQKFREMPLKVRYRILQASLGIKSMEVISTNAYSSDMAENQADLDIDVASILELLVEYHQRKKNQRN